MACSNGVAQGRASLPLAKLSFDLVKVSDEVDDAGRVGFSSVEGFDEAAPYVRHAATKVDEFGVVALVAGVDAVSVTLENSFPM